MRLKTLVLHNFKGIRDLTIEAGGADLDIFGDNATGKTTIADAISWLLFGKDSHGRAQFDIKTLDENGVAISKLDHSVKGIFEVDGDDITLKKTYYEKWTKKRGDANKTFTGHETDHFIDSVPKAKGQFQKKVAELVADEKTFQLLTSPSYFPNLKWQDQRQLLLDVCGDITDIDVIASNEDLAELPELMGKKSIDDFKAMIQSQRREVNDRLKSIPDRIDEATRAIPEDVIEDPKPVINKLKTLRGRLEKKEEEISSLKNGGGVAEKKREMSELTTEIIDARNAFNSRDNGLGAKRKELADLAAEKGDANSSVILAKKAIEQKSQHIAVLRAENAELVKRHREEHAKTFSGENECPTCGQQLPADQIEQAMAKFNENKANNLAKITEEGNQNAANIEEANDELTALHEELKGKEAKLEQVTEKVAALTKELQSFSDATPKFEDSGQFKELSSRKEKLQEEIDSLSADSTEAINEAEQEREAIKVEIKENDDIISAMTAAQRQRDRIDELNAEEKNLSAEYERLEGYLFLVEEFIKTKVAMLEEKINDRFELVKFKLFSVQINEGVKETCECTINGVPYGSLNSAGQVQAGLDIIRTLSNHYDFHPPIVIDGRESVTRLPEMDAQVISLIVSESDKALRVEIASEVEEVAA